MQINSSLYRIIMINKHVASFPRKSFSSSEINSKIIGINLDISHSNCGIYIDGKLELIQFQNGDSCLPNFVCYNPDNSDVLVGEQAKKKIFNDFRFYDSVALLELSYDEVISLSNNKKYPFKIVNDNGIPKFETKFNKETVFITASDITCEILKYIKKSADNKLDNDVHKITKAVMTIPKYFNELKRDIIKKSAKSVGIEIIEFIDEVKSSIISKCYIEKIVNKKIVKDDEMELILKLNESSFCCYLVKVNNNKKEYEIINENTIMKLSGYEISKRIENYILNIYERETGNSRESIETKKLLQLNKISSEAKQLLGLGIENEYEINWSVLMNEGIECRIIVDEFNEMCDDVFERIKTEIDNIAFGNRIDGIIEIGEICKYKKVEEIIRSKYSDDIVFAGVNNEDICCCGSVILGTIDGFVFNRIKIN